MPQILFANLAVASAMLNTLWLYSSGVLHYSEVAFDIADGLMRPVATLTAPVGIPGDLPPAVTPPPDLRQLEVSAIGKP